MPIFPETCVLSTIWYFRHSTRPVFRNAVSHSAASSDDTPSSSCLRPCVFYRHARWVESYGVFQLSLYRSYWGPSTCEDRICARP